MGDIADFYNDCFDQYDDRDEDGVVCKFCGEDGLHWEYRRGRWVLTDYDTGKEHRCAPDTDDFETLE